MKGGENMFTKKLLIPVVVIVLLGGLVLSAGHVGAQTEDNPASSLVSKIAQKFNLNKDDVQAVFDQAHKEKEAKMKAEMETNLTKAVTNGKITESQKQAIMEKFGTPFQIKIEKGDNLSEDDLHAKMKQHREDMEQWAQSIGLDLKTVHEVMGGGHKKGVMFKRFHP